MRILPAVLALSFSALAACSSTQSTIANEKTGYAISRTQAKEIVESSILANFSPDYVNRGPESSLTSSGYIRFALDTHTVNATAIPMRGVLPDGKLSEGYGFEVISFGTMPISGGSKAKSVYQLIKQQAQMAGSVLKTQ
ncbi:MAG: hypothetical protein ACOYM3_28235 [Terrimicrobiaceae bacterium]